MGGHKGMREPMVWTPQNERIFIEILYDSVKAGQLQTSTLSKEEWGKINRAMISATNKDYGIDRLKGKYNRLRTTHRQFSALLAHIGVTLDPDTHKVNSPEEVWQYFFTINKDVYKVLKNEGSIHYETLGHIFTGILANPSIQLPPTSEEEMQLEDDFFSGGVHVNVADDVDSEDISRTRRREEESMSGERRHKEPRVSKVKKLNACVTQWSSSFCMRHEEAELRTLYLKEKLAILKGKLGNASNSEATSPNLDPYSTKICLVILNSMEELSNEVYAKGITKFKDPDFRMSFVEMPGRRRQPVLELN